MKPSLVYKTFFFFFKNTWLGHSHILPVGSFATLRVFHLPDIAEEGASNGKCQVDRIERPFKASENKVNQFQPLSSLFH